MIKRADFQTLSWNKYVHTARILALGNGLYLNVILDPVRKKRILDLVTEDCSLLRRHVLETPLTFTSYANKKLAAVRTLEYPEVVIYDLRVSK